MVRHYTFTYGVFDAEVCFKVDTDVFTEEHAKAVLDFFTWNYDEEADPIDECMKKYAMECIIVGTKEDLNVSGVIDRFKSKEGYFAIDGSLGITLNVFGQYAFDEDNLDMEVVADSPDDVQNK